MKRNQKRKIPHSVLLKLKVKPVQTPMSTEPGLGTQPRYEVPGDVN